MEVKDKIATLEELKLIKDNTDQNFVTVESAITTNTVNIATNTNNISELEKEKANLEYVDSEDNKLKHSLNYTEDRLENVIHMLKGIAYKEITDDSTAYQKDVAYDSALGVLHTDGIEEWACVEEIGGKSIVWNQLFDTDNLEVPEKYLNGTVSGDASNFTITSTTSSGATAFYYKSAKLNNIFKLNHKYAFVSFVTTKNADDEEEATNFTFYVYVNTDTSSTAINRLYNGAPTVGIRTKIVSIGTIDTDATFNLFFLIGKSNNYTGRSITFENTQMFDLTQMFGAGNEPTVEEFEAMFPNDYYEYNAGEIIHAPVDNFTSAKADSTEISEKEIPSDLITYLADYGYGWGINDTCRNYIDFENKKFIQQVGRVDMGTLSWYCYNNKIIYAGVSGKRKVTTSGLQSILLTSKYTTVTTRATSQFTTNKTIGERYSTDGANQVCVYDSDYTDATEFKTAMAGVYLYYQLAEPNELDISAYLEDDLDLIQVDGGGTITFHHTNADEGYLIPSPSTVVYDLDIEEATNE